MRICSIITSFTAGGAEMLVTNLAEAFAARGNDADVVALSNAGQVGNPIEVERVLIDRVRSTGGSACSLALASRNHWWRGAEALRRLWGVHPPDIVHAHTVRALPLIALARPGVPVVLTHHNSRLPFPPSAFRLFDRIVSAYVAISNDCAATLARHARQPVRIILNAAGSGFMAAAPRRAPARDPLVLAVGTVSLQKDYPTLIRAARPLARRLAADGRRVRIRIAGGGPMLDMLRATLAAEDAGDCTELLGARSDVRELMRDADVFANTSLWEGFSIAMIEASMSALPVVATNVAGNREMVSEGSNGLLVPPGDPLAVANALAAVLTDVAGYTALSAGSLHAAGRFSMDACAAEHLGLYGELLSRTGARRFRISSTVRDHAARP